MAVPEDFRSAGVLPSGPVSAWPKERHDKMMAAAVVDERYPKKNKTVKEAGEEKVMPGLRQMAGGLLKTGKQAIIHGKVDSSVREERYATCRTCPAFNPKSKRCKECGCFMEAKTWVGGDPKKLCPLQKWVE